MTGNLCGRCYGKKLTEYYILPRRDEKLKSA
jgi:hypothetical protein